MNPRDLELLSVYLDGQLSPSDSTRLESRINSDPSLRDALNNLRSTRSLLRQLPSRRAPRNFTLTPQMAGVKPPTPRIVPVFRFASAFATFLFIITFLINGLFSFAASAPVPAAFNAAAPMSAAQAPAPQAFAAVAPTATDTSVPPMAFKSAPPQTENIRSSNAQTKSSLPLDLEIFFGILAIAFGITAWILPRNNERNLRKKWNKEKIKHKGHEVR